MKPILCVVDLTEASCQVLEVAATIASAQKAPLVILFSYRLINLEKINDTSKFRATMEELATEKFKKFEAEVLKAKGIPYEFQIEIGFLTDRINSHIKKDSAVMIVIGEKQASGIDESRYITLQQFIASTNLPFVIVPQKEAVEVVG